MDLSEAGLDILSVIPISYTFYQTVKTKMGGRVDKEQVDKGIRHLQRRLSCLLIYLSTDPPAVSKVTWLQKSAKQRLSGRQPDTRFKGVTSPAQTGLNGSQCCQDIRSAHSAHVANAEVVPFDIRM